MIRPQLFAAVEPIHAGVFAAVFVDGGLAREDIDKFQIVAFADLVVVGVVRRWGIFTAPVPNSRSTYSSAITGMARF